MFSSPLWLYRYLFPERFTQETLAGYVERFPVTCSALCGRLKGLTDMWSDFMYAGRGD